MTPGLLRILAWAIALAGVIDPLMTVTRSSRPEVALVSDDRLPDAGLVDRIERELSSTFKIIRGPSLGAAAVVSVGYQMPAAGARHSGRGFAVIPAPRSPFVTIASVSVSRQILLQARTRVDVRVRTVGADGRTLTVSLRRQGALIDQVTRSVSGNETIEPVPLQFVAAATGSAALVIEANIDGAHAATYSVARLVSDERWAVLAFDRRPSWMSTFVRRALESDPRFVVSSRVATSRGVPAVTAGQPPAALSQLPSLELFDVVIVGAPEALTEDDVRGLEGFMRQRGGAVVLLLDQPDSNQHSAALRSLTRVAHWTLTERAAPWSAPLASAVLRPSSMPRWAEPTHSAGAPASTESPSVWRTAVGRGSLVVSGALDAWRYRDGNAGAFGSYWRNVIANGAHAGSPATPTEVAESSTPRLEPDERSLIRNWAESRQGRTFSESELSALAPALNEALSPVSERQPDRPMQSPWWMLPFALALGGEWWMRRRSGLR